MFAIDIAQVDFHGVGNDKETTRRRADVPTLGPLSYSLPVTPLGRDGGACSMWDGRCSRVQGRSDLIAVVHGTASRPYYTFVVPFSGK